jgi:UDP-N-acetyl-2-amino-2-deoxyglucuronate dehydrogenase
MHREKVSQEKVSMSTISTRTLGLSGPLGITGRKLRFAIAGCGRISKNHFAAIRSHSEDIELVAVCDTEADRMEKLASEEGAAPYSSLSGLLASADVDVVVLATPSGLHARQAIEAAQAGCHVVTEKPMATRWEDGRHMVEVFDRAGLRLFVIKQNRRNPTLRLLKSAADRRRFGRIYMAEVNVFWTRPQEYYDSERWRGKWEFDGGALMNQASHYVDLLDWIVGPVESVQAYTGTLARNIEVEDTGVVGIKWRSGALGSLNVTMLAYPKNIEGSITILGERGTVRIGGVAANEIQHWEFDAYDPDDDLVANSSYEVQSVYGNGHTLYYKNVIEVLRGECEPETDGREGLRSLELLTAMYMSARDGRRISLPLQH